MPDFTLAPESAFARAPKSYDGIHITAAEDRAIVSLATPLGGDDALAAATRSAYGIAPPPVGHTATSANGDVTLARLAQDQMFALLAFDLGNDPVATVSAALGNAAYLTDQSDSWAGLRLDGPASRAALERICPLDLDASNFPAGSIARTAMEYLAVIVVCEAADIYTLLSPRSSADDFLHMVETSARNVT